MLRNRYELTIEELYFYGLWNRCFNCSEYVGIMTLHTYYRFKSLLSIIIAGLFNIRKSEVVYG